MTSNSSSHPALDTNKFTEMEASDMVRKLYRRLEKQGVPGDGYEEGLERSRNGELSIESVEGGRTVRGLKGIPADSGGTFILPLMEEEMLKKVDRYGFILKDSMPSSLAGDAGRTLFVPQSAFSVTPPLSASRVAKPIPQPPLSSLPLPSSPNVNSLDLELEERRVKKWAGMLQVSSHDDLGNANRWEVQGTWWKGRRVPGGSSAKSKYKILSRRVFKGIPDRWRSAVWVGMTERMVMEKRGTTSAPSVQEIEGHYMALLDKSSEFDVQIDLDIPRTVFGHVSYFTRFGQGQRDLFHVLHAFSIYSSNTCGYCQGMGSLVAVLLCYFPTPRAFSILSRVFSQYNLESLFQPGFPGLLELFYVQERLVEMLLPDVYEQFAKNNISTSAYATKWYITLFSNSVPFTTLLRIWDIFLLEGLDVLVVVGVAIIWSLRGDLTLPNADFETILSSLSSFFIIEDDDSLMRWVRKVFYRDDMSKKLALWRLEWRGFVVDGSASKRVT
ncbi:RabGAP/TBC [Meredithblackwellia eburnea MCA 4105]